MSYIWKLLFVVYTVYVLSEFYLFSYYLLNAPENGLNPDIKTYTGELNIFILWVGFYGLITSKKIINLNFWRIIFTEIVIFQVYNNISEVYEYDENYFDFLIEEWWLLILIASTIPAYVAVYLYSFKRNKIWI